MLIVMHPHTVFPVSVSYKNGKIKNISVGYCKSIRHILIVINPIVFTVYCYKLFFSLL